MVPIAENTVTSIIQRETQTNHDLVKRVTFTVNEAEWAGDRNVDWENNAYCAVLTKVR